MAAFLQSYGILILIGVVLLFLFVWISRSGHHNQVQPTGLDQQTGNDNKDNNNQHHDCC